MKLFFFILVILSGCEMQQSPNKNNTIIVGEKQTPGSNESVATFGEGCFWHSEIVFQSLVGVRDAVSGYAGGTDPNPDYEWSAADLPAMPNAYRYITILQRSHLKHWSKHFSQVRILQL